jgi:hypothetical protein
LNRFHAIRELAGDLRVLAVMMRARMLDGFSPAVVEYLADLHG